MYLKRAIALFSLTLLFCEGYAYECSGSETKTCETRSCEVRARTRAGCLCGRLRRADDGTVYASFRGVPYGEPPLRERRFQELQTVTPWRGLYDATEDPPACPQFDLTYGRMLLQIKGQSEDCIYLNLHVPRAFLPKPCGHGKRKLPVLVFIHGGALQSGSGLTDVYGPEYLMSKPVVVITFNYRLSVFGFLYLNTKEIPGNQGLRDMVTLLKWVKQNVHAFGGDPDNVTLMGQSAGASSAHILSLSTAAQGLFQRLILLSGTAYPSYFTTSAKYAEDIAEMFLQRVGINVTTTDPADIHEELINMPLLKIMNANTDLLYKSGFTSFSIVEESEFPGITRIVEENPLALIAKGRGREYPTIVSFTDKELFFAKWLLTNKNILGKLQSDPTAIVETRLQYSLSKDEITDATAKIYEKYFKGETPTLEQLMTYYTELVFQHSGFKVAQWRAATGGAPMYLMQYSYEAEYSPVKAGLWLDYPGAAHMDDLASIFRVNSLMGDYTAYPPKSKDDYMKVWMVHLITNFATCGKPLCCNCEDIWPPVAKGKILYNDVKEPFDILLRGPTRELVDMVQFFDSFDPEVSNITASLGAGWY